MSNTPKNADACLRLLDNGWQILLLKNGLGTYSAIAIDVKKQTAEEACKIDKQITDDFLPSQALYRLSEKMIGNIVDE